MTTLIQKTLASLALAATMVVGAAAMAPTPALAGHNDGYRDGYGRATQAHVGVDLNMRYGPSIGYHVLRVIPQGRPVDVLRCMPNRDWCEVSFNGRNGWVVAYYLDHPRYGVSYDQWDSSDWVRVFDFFLNITDYDNDRRHRYDGYRWGDDYYRDVRRNGHRSHHDWYRRHDNGRHIGYNVGRGHRNHGEDRDYYDRRDRHDRDDRDWNRDRDSDRDRDRDRRRDRDGRWGR